jgi:hypothetical protein
VGREREVRTVWCQRGDWEKGVVEPGSCVCGGDPTLLLLWVVVVRGSFMFWVDAGGGCWRVWQRWSRMSVTVRRWEC